MDSQELILYEDVLSELINASKVKQGSWIEVQHLDKKGKKKVSVYFPSYEKVSEE